MEALRQRRSQIVRDIQTLELDLAGLEARLEATEKQVARTHAETEDELANDTVTEELQKLIKFQMDILARQRQEVEYGQRPISALAEAEESLAKAKIELARRKEELARQAGGGRLAELGSQLSKIALDRVEKRARLDVLKRQLAEVEKELGQIAAYEAKASQIESAKMTLKALGQKLAELKTEQASLHRPLVTVIGAN